MQCTRRKFTTICQGTIGIIQNVAKKEYGVLRRSTLAPSFTRVRSFTVNHVQVSDNIDLATTGKDVKIVRENTVKIIQSEKKPLVIIFPWLGAKRSLTLKYRQLYTDQGFDVLRAHITPWQLMWPASSNGSQKVAKQVMEFLHANNSYDRLFIHGFSVGGYIWGETLNQLTQKPEIYQRIKNKCVGQIWDSWADVTQIPEGFPRALFPKNEPLRKMATAFIRLHMRIFYSIATRHYNLSSKKFHEESFTAPALFLLSKTDPVGEENSIRVVHDEWVEKGVETYWKCWERSPHVDHFRTHPFEYIEHVATLLKKVNLLPFPEKFRP